MCAALGSMLSVNKRVILFPVLFSAVCKSKFQITFFNMNYRIKRWAITVNISFKQIAQAIFGIKPFSIEFNRKAIVQKDIIPQQFLYVFINKMIIAKNFIVRDKRNNSAVFFIRIMFRYIIYKYTP